MYPSMVFPVVMYGCESWTVQEVGCFCILAIVNNAAVNTGVHVSFQITVFVLSGYMPRSRIAGLCAA